MKNGTPLQKQTSYQLTKRHHQVYYQDTIIHT